MAAVVHDYAATCHLAMEELLSTNPQSLAYVGWTLDAFWSRLREREFSSLAALRGLPYCRFTHLLAEQGEAKYQQALRKWISELPSGCAIFAANDKVAARVLAACKAVGRLVPEDLVLLGVDYDPSVCDASVPMLSSVRLDFEMAGYRSAELLDALIAGAVRTPVREAFGPLCVIRSESTRRRPRRVGAILDAMSLIREQACDGLDVDAVVAVMKMPRRTAELRFREVMGTSIAGEIGKIRMQRVTQLLSDGTVPIGEIAGRCGYRTGQALRKSFHAWTGKSLREWRQDADANGFEPGGTGK